MGSMSSNSVVRLMTRGYVLVYDERRGDGDDDRDSDSHGFDEERCRSGNALLQKKAYFQNFSIQRNVFAKEPVCGNPGQYTLPGGKMNADIVAEWGTLEATLKQFYEESGISVDRMRQLNCTDQGYFAPSDTRRGRGVEFVVHFVQVDDVSALAEEANNTLDKVRDLVDLSGRNTSSSAEREASLRKLCATTGLNDDAAAGYEVVPWGRLLDKLLTSLEFEEASREEWARLVREQGLGLFFSVSGRAGCSIGGGGGQEEMIRSTIADPGSNRDWLVDGVKAFLAW